jgi:predicted DNA-binding transcriptional regulator YafY
MLGIPAPLAELGLDQELRTALLKLSASLPTARRQDEERTSQRIHLDPAGWFESREPIPLLSIIQQALWADHTLWLTYSLPFETIVERLVEPYGLVAKAAVWYLVCGQGEHVRVLRVSQLLRASLTGQPFTRPATFHLAQFWRAWCAEAETNRPRYPVTMRVAPELIPYLPNFFGDSIEGGTSKLGPADDRGWVKLTISLDSLEDARSRILGCGGSVEVLDPPALRLSVSDFAAQIVAQYAQ